MHKQIPLIITTILLFIVFSLTPNPAAASGEISVQGTTILRDGQPWIAKGISIVGRTAPAAATKPGDYAQARAQFSAQELEKVKELFGADLIRFQVSQGGANPQSSIYSTDYLKEVQSAVKMARDMGFTVIVCVDGERSGGLDERGMPNEKTLLAWKSLAPLFANDRGVMFELFNEPQPDGPDATPHDWDHWKAGMQPLVDEIRSLGAKNVLLADGLYWAQMLNSAPKLDDPLSEVVYAIHPYFAPKRLADEAAWFDMFGRFAIRHAVLASEWSALSFGSNCNDNTPNFAAGMLNYLKQQKIGVVGWAFDFPRTLLTENGTLTNYNGFHCGPKSDFGPGELIAQYFKEK